MIDEAKPPHPAPLEGTALYEEGNALLVRSTYSYHFVTKKTGAAPSSAGDRPTAGDERRR